MTVESTASVPVTFVLDVRVMIHFVVEVRSVICEAVKPSLSPFRSFSQVRAPGLGVALGREQDE